MSGWIKIHRKFLDWQWFEKSEAVHLFIYLLLKANHKDSQWQGIDIKRGQFISSLGKISTDTGISLQSIRTLLNKLEKTNEIELKSTNKFTIVTICKYECPIKEATQETILAKMENFTEEQCKFVINNSIENGWQGLFWDKLPKHETELSDDLQQTANILAKLNYIDTKDYKNAD